MKTMNIGELYSDIINDQNEGNRIITLIGRPGMGKTQTAANLAAIYVTTERQVLYITDCAAKFPWNEPHKMDIPEKSKEKIIIFEEPYKCRDDRHILKKAYEYCLENPKIELLIIDDDMKFCMDSAFLAQCNNIIVNLNRKMDILLIGKTSRKVESIFRASKIPKLKDAPQQLVKVSDAVYTIYRDNYYDLSPEADRRMKFIRVK